MMAVRLRVRLAGHLVLANLRMSGGRLPKRGSSSPLCLRPNVQPSQKTTLLHWHPARQARPFHRTSDGSMITQHSNSRPVMANASPRVHRPRAATALRSRVLPNQVIRFALLIRETLTIDGPIVFCSNGMQHLHCALRYVLTSAGGAVRCTNASGRPASVSSHLRRLVRPALLSGLL